MTANSRLVAMLDDPECVDDVLLVGVGLIALVDFRREGLAKTAHIGALVRGGERRMPGWWAKHVIAEDARTYRPPRSGWSAPCEAPMVRRDGLCGRSEGGGTAHLRDYDTGEIAVVKHCSRHRSWAEDLERRNRAAAPYPKQPRGGAPLPAANHGGVLARHFPEIDWPMQCSPGWVEHPEAAPRPRPTLTLLVGDDEGDAIGARPVLSLAAGGAS